MTRLTESAEVRSFNGISEGGVSGNHHTEKDKKMFTSIIVTAVIAGALGYGLRSSRGEDIIVRHPYNNRHSDASGAREDHFV